MSDLFQRLLVIDDFSVGALDTGELSTIFKEFIEYKDFVGEYIHTYYRVKGDYAGYCEVILPFGDIVYFTGLFMGEKSLDCIHLPFMTCDKELWDYLIANPDNPLFKLLGLLSDCSHRILVLMMMHEETNGVAHDVNPVFTFEDMRKEGILDILGVAPYIPIYESVSKYVPNDPLVEKEV